MEGHGILNKRRQPIICGPPRWRRILLLGICLVGLFGANTKSAETIPNPSVITPTNQSPTLTILPETGSWFLSSQEIELLIEASDWSNLKSIQLFQGSLKTAEAGQSPMRYTLTNPSSGTYTFVAKAIDKSGMSITSSPVTINFKAPGPMVSLVPGPSEFISSPFVNESPATLMASVIGVNPGSLATLVLNDTPQPLRTGNFTLTPPLAEGENTFVLIATDREGRTAKATAKLHFDSKPPVVSVENPTNGTPLDIMRVNVSGTFVESSLKQITVNNARAFISGDRFQALNIFLAPGTNIITAVAEDMAGNKGVSTVTILGPADTNAYQLDPVQLIPDRVGGFAPFKASFKVRAKVPGKIQQVHYDFDGDHVTDKSASNLDPVTYTYSEPGERFPIVTLETAAGRFSSIGPGFWMIPGIRINVEAPPVQMAVINVPDPVDIKWAAPGSLYVLSGKTATLTEFGIGGRPIRSLKDVGSRPSGFDVDTNGNVYVAISGSHQIWRFKPTSNSFEPDRRFGNGGFVGNRTGVASTNAGQFSLPFDVVIASTFDGEQVFVSDSGNHRIQLFSKDGAFIDSFGQRGTNLWQFNSPKGLAFDRVGYLFINDFENNRIVVARDFGPVAASGAIGSALGQFRAAGNLAVGERGICVVDAGNNRVQIFDPIRRGHGARLTPFVPRVEISSELGLNHPTAVTWVDNPVEEKLCIGDAGNDRVILINLPLDYPEAVWNAMKQRLLAGDIDGAIPFFSSSSAERYRQTFHTFGTNALIQAFSLGPAITPIFVKRDSAQYRFSEEISKEVPNVPIEFVKENGTWKILEY